MYAFEITSLKEKRQYNLLDINIHLHEANNRCFVLAFEKAKDKIEVYECEQASDVYNTFQEFKRISEEIDEKNSAQLTKSKSVIVTSKK